MFVLSQYKVPRIQKTKILYIEACSNAGKSTLQALFTKVFYPFVFDIGEEASSSFQLQPFVDKSKSVLHIWLDAEFAPSVYRNFTSRNFNMVVEGFVSKTVAVKNRVQQRLEWRGHVMLFTNYNASKIIGPETMEDYGIKLEELKNRVVRFKMIKPPCFRPKPGFSITRYICIYCL